MKKSTAGPSAQIDSGNTRYRFEQWVQNPACAANVLSAVSGVRMSDIAKLDAGKEPPGPSPFALTFGISFEDGLFRDEAKVFREDLARAGLVPNSDQTRFVDFRIRANRGKLKDIEEAKTETHRFLQVLPATNNESQFILASGITISVPGKSMLPEAILVLDALLLKGTTTGWDLFVGEIKTFPDRGGYTNGSQLATARAQAGVYAYGLGETVLALQLAGKLKISNKGFLVFSKPGTRFPSIRPNEDLTYQIERAARGFAQLRTIAAQQDPIPFEQRTNEVLVADTAYSESCYSFCPRAGSCFKREFEQGNPIVLGTEVERFTNGILLDRVLDLINSKSEPKNAAETDFLERFKDLEIKLSGTG